MRRKVERSRRSNRKNELANLTAVAAFACLLILLPLVKIAAQTALPPGVAVRLEAIPRKATIGDPVQIELDVTTPPGYRVEMQKPQTKNEDFAILSFSSESTAAEPNKSLLHHRAQMTAAIYKSGSFTFPPVQIFLEDSTGNKTIISSPPIDIEIQSVIGKDFNLKDLKKQAEIPEKFRWRLWAAIALAGCILALIGRGLWRRMQSNSAASPPTIPVVDPLDAYESELKDLLARGLPSKGHEKKFYVLLSDVVKRILESGFGIRAVEQTTSEIMESMRQTAGLSGEKTELTEAFLMRCDIVKFAKYLPSKAEHETAGKNALAILGAARANRRRKAFSNQPSEISE